ncbi:hypothetical protein RF11_04110 [Thelohanellus kitauei]|uniref:Uncharacterized protein n=1 Tax=Thelohanellus kitauei TaxID=669202 RepID=A0A0C2MW17_THEKT|nr:hypothetical protein RF11_04110 [Thelohanellus kitauei]
MPDFQQGLCGCFSNMESCICACCCPCVSAGYIAEKTGDNLLLVLLLWFVFPPAPPIYLRNKIRKLNHIEVLICGITLGKCMYGYFSRMLLRMLCSQPATHCI